ncbi:MAG: hypothetical protein R3281_17705, partial [Balneolaceae bacterium]|nr:hypothetical protein [Balneolaceae bacterium]
MEQFYISEILLALTRIGLCAYLFYGLFAVLLCPGTKDRPFEDRLVYKWTIFTGYIIAGVIG